MSAHAVGVFGVGTEPPPDSRLPRLSLVILAVSVSTAARSACVIWPIFSASVIRPRRSATRCFTDSEGFWYGRAAPDAGAEVRVAVAEAPGACQAVRVSARAAAAPHATARRRRWIDAVMETPERCEAGHEVGTPQRWPSSAEAGGIDGGLVRKREESP